MDAEMSSPAPDSPAMEGILTPRSKVAKMLADIDNAPTPSPPETTKVDNVPTNPRSHQILPPSNAPFLAESSDDSDDEDNVRRPTGIAARRMLGQTSATMNEASRQESPNVSASLDDDEDLYSATPAKRRQQETFQSHSRSARSQNLFVSPAKTTQSDSDDDLPEDPRQSGSKLAALVAQKRAEREAKEAEEANRLRSEHVSSDLPDELLEDERHTVNPDIERIMSDAAPPTRKASKKALLEMERETQRMAREQALAHQMKVKKKFTMSDLFAKFNYRQAGQQAQAEVGADTSGSSAPNSDATEPAAEVVSDTPPSSPPAAMNPEKQALSGVSTQPFAPIEEQETSGDELPEIGEILRKKAAVAEESKVEQVPKVGLKVAKFGKKAAAVVEDDSDDELEILPAMPPHLRAFDLARKTVKNRPDNSSKAIHTLRHLAHMGQYESRPGKKGTRPSVDPVTLEVQLRKKARDQARKEQLERIEELKAKGIDIQSAEDREKEAEIFENLLEKARQEAVELRKLEKKAASGKDVDGEGVMVASDDESEDDDYAASGSEDEDEAGGENDNDQLGLVDEAADETDDDDAEGEDDGSEEEDAALDDDQVSTLQDQPSVPTNTRKVRKSRVIVEDDDDEDQQEEALQTPAIGPQSQDVDEQQDDPFAAFGFANDQVLLSPTQAFNATMQTPTQATQEDSFNILGRIAPSSASSLVPAPSGDGYTQTQSESQMNTITASQPLELGWETQAPETPSHGPERGASALIETPGWEPTQDLGLPSPMIGLNRENTLESVPEHDTQSTVRLRISESPAPSAPQARRGRLVRRQNLLPDSDEDEDEEVEPTAGINAAAEQVKKDAFREMARKRKEALTETERAEARKEMRGMMDEDAEESEDEYAGLGGDDFVAPETEQDRQMIDSSLIDVDERAIAAHYAERERLREEEETSKLYKDLTTGALRRKQANMFDLDDDEDEMAIRRRQIKQREEARKRKLLLQDDNIAGLAEGRQSRGKDAFLKAIADDDGDDEMLDLSDGEAEDTAPATQDDSQASTQAPEVLQEISSNKRKLAEGEERPEDRPPAKQRRTQPSAFRRPASLLEVQESVSFLLDDPSGGSFNASTIDIDSDENNQQEQSNEVSEDSDGEDAVELEKTRENDGGFAPNPAAFDAALMPPPRLPASQRRTQPMPPAVVDRLSLKRNNSSSSNGSGRNAWAAGSSGVFKAPSLLRRATTNMITGGANERGVTTPILGREGSGTKMGGSKKSSLAYQARADERKAIVEASARRRQENTAKIAELRRTNTVGGLLGKGLGGKFE